MRIVSRSLLASCGLGMAGAAGCIADATEPPVETVAADNGSLIRLDMDSQVGVLLDELPAGAVRDSAAANAAAQPASFWIARAKRQVRLMNYRLVFRRQYYNSYWSNTGKDHGSLPLPPNTLWNVTLTGTPHRVTNFDGHDVMVVSYHFSSTLLSDAPSPAIAEASLGTIGGTTDESFTFPVDPELLLQRTGFACMDEDEFPPGSVFEENTAYFYDDACTSSPTSTCHITVNNTNSCNAALTQGVGRAGGTLHFTRLAFDGATADAVRVGTVNAAATNPPAPDLAVVGEGLTDEHAFAYRFFTTGSCELDEGVISQLGWRRLLLFSATIQNDGGAEINVGGPTDPANPFVQGNVFEYSQCHHHYHFSHYGTFGYGGAPGSKRAFCLEDTNRYHNDESTSLDSIHRDCGHQGVSRGWGDEYNWGIPGQWVDATSVTSKKTPTLSFLSNPDQFLCEGALARDASGNVILDSTSFINPVNGQPELRPRCNFVSNWNANNFASTPVPVGSGSFVTNACARGQVGPNKDCGFAPHPVGLKSCTSGAIVTLSCKTTSSALQVLRICDKSAQLATGVACPLRTSYVNRVIGPTPTTVTFTCPSVLDAQVVNQNGTLVPQPAAGVGGYSVYQSAIGTLASTDAGTQPAISCTGW